MKIETANTELDAFLMDAPYYELTHWRRPHSFMKTKKSLDDLKKENEIYCDWCKIKIKMMLRGYTYEGMKN